MCASVISQPLIMCGSAVCARSDISVSLGVIQRWRCNSSAEHKNNTFISLLQCFCGVWHTVSHTLSSTGFCFRYCFIPFAVLFLSLPVSVCFSALCIPPEQKWFCPIAHALSFLFL